MPNLTTAKAFNLYAAALEHMASTHCTPGNRISHWIMHNEVDFANEWTNMGDQPMMRYLDRYIKSMRICYNIARQYDQNASVLGSYTHCWTLADGNYAPKKMLEATVAYSEAEGDFRWGVAYHPYPQDLTKPSFWIDDTQATYSLNSKYVTFKNLEVIDAWIRQKENFYKGKTKRPVPFRAGYELAVLFRERPRPSGRRWSLGLEKGLQTGRHRRDPVAQLGRQQGRGRPQDRSSHFR